MEHAEETAADRLARDRLQRQLDSLKASIVTSTADLAKSRLLRENAELELETLRSRASEALLRHTCAKDGLVGAASAACDSIASCASLLTNTPELDVFLATAGAAARDIRETTASALAASLALSGDCREAARVAHLHGELAIARLRLARKASHEDKAENEDVDKVSAAAAAEAAARHVWAPLMRGDKRTQDLRAARVASGLVQARRIAAALQVFYSIAEAQRRRLLLVSDRLNLGLQQLLDMLPRDPGEEDVSGGPTDATQASAARAGGPNVHVPVLAARKDALCAAINSVLLGGDVEGIPSGELVQAQLEKLDGTIQNLHDTLTAKCSEAAATLRKIPKEAKAYSDLMATVDHEANLQLFNECAAAISARNHEINVLNARVGKPTDEELKTARYLTRELDVYAAKTRNELGL